VTDIPEPEVMASRYLVSCLPEGHEERFLFTIQVDYRGNGLWAVINRTRLLGKDGTWSFGADLDNTDDLHKAQEEWIADHRFDHDTAIRLAKQAAKNLSYRNYTVAEALKECQT
jgi:hypothetical protein